jgi:hypothetical protein
MTSLALVMGLSACDQGALCPQPIDPAIIVTIREAGTLRPIADEARGVIREGSYVDSLRPYQPNVSRAAGNNRDGTYSIEIHREGSVTWTRAGVQVPQNGCFTVTQNVTADLVPITQ